MSAGPDLEREGQLFSSVKWTYFISLLQIFPQNGMSESVHEPDPFDLPAVSAGQDVEREGQLFSKVDLLYQFIVDVSPEWHIR